MFSTDSLAWQWRIPELARQIYRRSAGCTGILRSGRAFWLSACFSVRLNSGRTDAFWG